MILIVGFTGTLVNRFSTSREASIPVVSLPLIRSMNSLVELREYLAGIYFTGISFGFCATLYVGVPS